MLSPRTSEHGRFVLHPLMVPVVGGWHHDRGEFGVPLERGASPFCSAVSSAHVLWSLEHSIHVHNLDSGVEAGGPVTSEGDAAKLSPPGVSISSGASGSPPGEVSEVGAAFSALTRSLSDSSTSGDVALLDFLNFCEFLRKKVVPAHGGLHSLPTLVVVMHVLVLVSSPHGLAFGATLRVAELLKSLLSNPHTSGYGFRSLRGLGLFG